MADWKSLAGKTVKTLREDGLQKVGQKAKLYLKRKREERSEEAYSEGCFRDVLFINGCDEHLPHPGRYRVSHQREQLESLGMTTGEVYYQNLKPDTLRCYRIFIFFRCPYTDLIGDFVKTAREINKTVLYDVDDLVIDTVYTDMIPYLATMSEEERRAYDDGVRSMGKLLRMCDGAITTTGCLAQELEQYVPRVLVNRNVASEEMVKLSRQALQEEEGRYRCAAGVRDESSPRLDLHGSSGEVSEQKAETEAETEREKAANEENVKIGYFSGSITHNDDFQLILPVIVKLLETYQNLQLHLVGELSLPEELLPYQGKIVVHPFVGWRELPGLIAGVDINLAPLTTTTFNRAKSENKWVEAALVKVPTVASDIGAFHEMVENGKTGILCQNQQQWEEALQALIEQPAYRKVLGEAAYAYCSAHCVTAHTGKALLDFLQEQKRENIAFLLPAFQISGGVMVALQHCRILQEAGRDVLLLSIEERGKERWYEFEGCRFPVCNCHDTRFYGVLDQAVATMWSTVDWLYRIPGIKRKGYLVQNYEPDFYASGDPLRMQARRTYGCLEDLSYLTISRWCQEWLLEQYGHEAAYAPNGLELKKFRACEAERLPVGQMEEAKSAYREEAIGSERKIRILIEGDSSAPHKNVDESFRIVEKLDREKYEIWYMAYHGEPKEWYQVDKFLPRVPYGEVQNIYRDCDILLKSSILESFSYPPLEMMAAGGCVVAVLNGGNREYLEDGKNCLCYPQGDIQAGAEAIERIRRDSGLREYLRENGLETAAGREWELIREQILNLYR